MAGPIYKLWMARPNRAFWQLSDEDRQALMAKVTESLQQVGGKTVVACASVWANEQWTMFGVEEFPDVEAVQKLAELHMEIGWIGYGESFSLLGLKWPPE